MKPFAGGFRGYACGQRSRYDGSSSSPCPRGAYSTHIKLKFGTLHCPIVIELRPPEVVERLPPSARLVYEKLQLTGPLTHRGLVQSTGMPPRTVRYAVGRLKEAGVIGARCNLMDCRQCYFFVSQQCAGGGKSPFVLTPWQAL